MIETPRIAQTAAQETAIIRLTIPREQIRQMMGPAIGELTFAAKVGVVQMKTPAGQTFELVSAKVGAKTWPAATGVRAVLTSDKARNRMLVSAIPLALKTASSSRSTIVSAFRSCPGV